MVLAAQVLQGATAQQAAATSELQAMLTVLQAAQVLQVAATSELAA
jgi:hypothetical protein